MDAIMVDMVKFAPAVVVMAWVIMRQDKRIDQLITLVEKLCDCPQGDPEELPASSK